MKQYQLTVVFPGEIAQSKIKSFQKELESMLKVFKGKLNETKDLGKIELAYLIKKNSTGYFMQYELELETSGVSELSRKVELEKDVIRHLMVMSDQKPESKSKKTK